MAHARVRNHMTSMDSLATAPFDDAMQHIHYAQQQIHQHMLQHLPPPPLYHPNPYLQAELSSVHERNVRQMHEFAAHAQQTIANMHEHAVMLQSSMLQNLQTLAADMSALRAANFQQFPQLMHTATPHGRPHSVSMTRFPPIYPHHHGQPDLSYESMLALDQSIKKRGVAPSDLAKLKRARHTSNQKCKQCGICQDHFSVGTKIIVLPCSHAYCEKEILTWFEQNVTCPTCRFRIEDIRPY